MNRAILSTSFLALVAAFPRPMVGQGLMASPHERGGGAQVTVVSIVIPPIPDAPFIATVSTTWKKTLGDGNTVTIGNHRTVARDSAGRVFEERRYLLPAGDSRESVIRQMEFADPRTHMVYYCKPDQETCEIYNYFVQTTLPPLVPAGPLDNGKRFLTRVDLGRDTVEGVETIGTRETVTVNPGAMGNDRAYSIVKEFWYSAQLGVNLIEKRQEPGEGDMEFIVGQITRGEPDPRLFEMPDFRIVDMRKNN